MLKDVHRSVRSPVSTVKSRRVLSCLCLHAKRYTKKHPDMYAHVSTHAHVHIQTCMDVHWERARIRKEGENSLFQSLLDIGR